MTDAQRLGLRIRFARSLAGRTQQQCADAMGIHRTAFVKIESGERAITVSEIVKLARHLMLDMHDLLTVQPLEEAFPHIHVCMVEEGVEE